MTLCPHFLNKFADLTYIWFTKAFMILQEGAQMHKIAPSYRVLLLNKGRC